jgi:hypothetical protein
MSVFLPNYEERPTYIANANLAGAANKNMLSLLNPAASGKCLKIREFWALVKSSSGTTVVIGWEVRRLSAHSGGTVLTSVRNDLADPVTVGEARSAPDSVTDVELYRPWVVQINTSQSPFTYMLQFQRDPYEKPLVLRPGQGICFKQIQNNTSTFDVGVRFTEEDT